MPLIPGWFRYTLLTVMTLGGLHGIVTALLLWPHAQGFELLLMAWVVVSYTFVVVAGLALWRAPDRLAAVRLALAIQIPWISSPAFVYVFAAGMYATLGFTANRTGGKYSAGFTTNFDVGSFFSLRLFQESPFVVAVNLVPLAALLLLNRLSRPRSKAILDPTTRQA